jgi:hypothetical protein
MNQKVLQLVLLAGTLCMLLVMRWHGQLLSSFPESPAGIVSLELAKSRAQTDSIISAWSAYPSKDVVKHAIQNTRLDFLFLLFYSLLLFTLCQTFSFKQKGITRTISHGLATGSLLAGLLDVMENLLLLEALQGNSTPAGAWLAWLFATVKFALVGIIVLWLLYCYLSRFLKRRSA